MEGKRTGQREEGDRNIYIFFFYYVLKMRIRKIKYLEKSLVILY